MDRILTIISEYNPFHLGHFYHLNQSIEKTDAKYKIAIISGNFVQRGEPSIIDKWAKTKLALEAGFDMVIELPTIYAISSAENFALGGIKIANFINADYLSFGSENGNIETLEELTNLISQNEEKYYEFVRDFISKGYSYPKSQEMAINSLFGKKYASLCTPNNILGFEYIKNIRLLKSKTKLITIKRNSTYKSASEIRELIVNKKSCKRYLPAFTISELDKNENIVYSLKAFEKEIFYKLRTMTEKEYQSVPDIPDNLINKLRIAAGNCNSLDDLFENIKNKSITAARIKRILLYILLEINKQDINISKETMPYIRILGVKKNSKELLSYISKKKNVITSVKDFESNCKNKKLLRMLEIDIKASNIYTLAYKRNSKSNLDYTQKLIII